MIPRQVCLYSIVIGFVWLAGCNNSPEAITPQTMPVTESVYASGKIKSRQQYQVYSKVSGILQKIYTPEGTAVKRGDILFTLEKDNASIATENARLASATADFATNAGKLKEAKRAIDLAVRKLQQDSILLQRQQNLWRQGIGSKIELEQKELAYESSKLGVTNARLQYEDLERQLKLAAGQSRNNLQIARITEADFTIRSEADGTVLKINKEPGELVNSANPIAIIGAGDFIIELIIDELDITKITKGQTVIVRMDSYASSVYEAVITFINPMMDERSRSFTAEAVFTKAPPTLFANLTVEASIVIRTKNNALTIPRSYLVNDSSVMLEDGSLQKVSTGLMDYNLAEITAGLKAETKIIKPTP